AEPGCTRSCGRKRSIRRPEQRRWRTMIQITIIALIICLLFGIPIAFAIGIAGTVGLYFGSNLPMFMVVKQFFEGINSFSYMAIPLFILAGAIMAKGGIAKRIVNFASALLSWLRGGTA